MQVVDSSQVVQLFKVESDAYSLIPDKQEEFKSVVFVKF